MEAAGSSLQPSSRVRNLINNAYERVVNGMVSSLDAIARESDMAGDDKEQLNAHIITVGRYMKRLGALQTRCMLTLCQSENMHHFYHELRAHKIQVLDRWVKYAKSQYDANLNGYIKVVIRRPLGRLLVRHHSYYGSCVFLLVSE